MVDAIAPVYHHSAVSISFYFEKESICCNHSIFYADNIWRDDLLPGI